MSLSRSVPLMALFLYLCSFASVTHAQQTYIYCGSLIDGRTEQVRENVTIVVEGERFAAVEQGFKPASGSTRVIDLKDKTVLPGLIDMHVHIESESSADSYINRFTLNDAELAYNGAAYARTTLMSGFTTVRDVGGRGVNIALRDAVNAGKIPGPRIFTSGKAIATTGGHADSTNSWRDTIEGDPGPKKGVANGTDAMRKAVRQRYKNGADLIKITATGGELSQAKSSTAPQFSPEELNALIETANDIGFQVAAHAHGAEGMKRAVRAGVKTIEHGTLMDRETMELMKQHVTYYVPTITAGWSVADSAKIPAISRKWRCPRRSKPDRKYRSHLPGPTRPV